MRKKEERRRKHHKDKPRETLHQPTTNQLFYFEDEIYHLKDSPYKGLFVPYLTILHEVRSKPPFHLMCHIQLLTNS